MAVEQLYRLKPLPWIDEVGRYRARVDGFWTGFFITAKDGGFELSWADGCNTINRRRFEAEEDARNYANQVFHEADITRYFEPAAMKTEAEYRMEVIREAKAFVRGIVAELTHTNAATQRIEAWQNAMTILEMFV